MTTTDRRRRPHPARGARWFSAGLAVAGTLGISTYLELDAHQQSGAGEVVEAASRIVPVVPPVQSPIVQSPTVQRPSATVTVPPAPRATIVPSVRAGSSTPQRSTHTRSMGSPG